MITVEHLTKEFGRTHAVCDASFGVERGQVVALLGPNGSGKTTIMRILTGFFPPTEGRAWVAGINVVQDPFAARQRVGYMPESVALYPDMRVEQFLNFCADVRSLHGAHRRRRVAAVLGDCGLREVRQRLIGKLSRGYRQRVGLAQALLHEPEVLILDEPTVGLDPRQIIEIRNLIRDLRGRTTVLLSTHILPEAAATCEQVIIVHRGRIVAEDTAEHLTHAIEGGERTLARIDGPADLVLAALREIPGVDGVERHDRHDCYMARARNGDSTRRAIAAEIGRRGWGLMELVPMTMTLEDLFVRLVNDEDASPEAAHRKREPESGGEHA